MKTPLPCDTRLEAEVISGIWDGLIRQETWAFRALASLKDAHFLAPAHRLLWEATQRLQRRGESPEPFALRAELNAMEGLERAGGWQALVEISALGTGADYSPAVARLQELWRRRELIHLGEALFKQAADLTQDLESLEAQHHQALTGMSSLSSVPIRSFAEDLDRVMQGQSFADPRAQGKLLWLGLAEIDSALEAAPGHLIILAARPKVGKSALAVQATCLTASKGTPVLFVSLEMDDFELGARMAAHISGLEGRAFRSGRYLDSQHHGTVSRYLDSQETLACMHRWCHPQGVPWGQVEARIREAHRSHGVRAVVLDYFTLLGKPFQQKGSNDAAAWGQLCTGIKRLAQELGICVLLLSQLNREADGIEPGPASLRETGQLEQDANAVVMLWRDKQGAPMAKLALNRSGASVPNRALALDGATNRIRVMDRETNPAPQVSRFAGLDLD